MSGLSAKERIPAAITLALALVGLNLGRVAAAPTPRLVADVNCDGRTSAADFVAAVRVSIDSTQFPDCARADQFRDRALAAADFVPLLHDIFGTFNQPATPTATASRTVTSSPSRTPTPSPTPGQSPAPTTPATPSPTATQTPTPLPTNTPTFTFTPLSTHTPTPTRTPTATPTPQATRTPTGVAYQLSGEWRAQWTGQVCYLNGQPFSHLSATTYRVTAVDGQLDIEVVGGPIIGRGLPLTTNNTVQTEFRVAGGNLCPADQVDQEFVFDYSFMFSTAGTGAATVHWTYGFNAHCAVCAVDDTATLLRQ